MPRGEHIHVVAGELLAVGVESGDIPAGRTVRRVLGKKRKGRGGKRRPASFSGEPVYFYEREGYRLSNFSSHAIEFEVAGKVHIFMSCEHAYQASKFFDDDVINKIGLAWSAEDAKAIAHAHRHLYRPDWSEPVKLRVMEQVFRAKARQHRQVREYLASTRGRKLVENSLDDDFWGIGCDKTGRNHAGRLWMKIRSDYQ